MLPALAMSTACVQVRPGFESNVFSIHKVKLDTILVNGLRKEQKYKKWPGLTHTNKKYYNKQKNN